MVAIVNSQKNEIKPWSKKSWVIPLKADAEYTKCMEDILDIYAKELSDDEIVICMDESNKQHIEETKEPIPAKPGESLKYDYEYKRNGVSALFMFFFQINHGGMLLLKIIKQQQSGYNI